MRKCTNSIGLLLIVAGGISAVLAPSVSAANSPRWEGIQLVRFVIKKNSDVILGETYHHEVGKGILAFDDQLRHPSVPPGPALVDCAETDSFGLTFLARRSTRFVAKNVKARFEWNHSGLGADQPAVVYHQTRAFLRDEKAKLFTSGIGLEGKYRIDGIVSLKVTIGRIEAARNSFRLTGCPVTDRTSPE